MILLNPDVNKKEKINKTKNLLPLRIILILLILIIIPYEKLASTILFNFEEQYITTSLSENLTTIMNSSDYSTQKAFQYLSKLVLFLLSEPDCFFIYSSLFFVILEPFIIIKVVIISNTINYLIVLLRFLYQDYRPFWKIPGNYNSLCKISFSSPSIRISSTCGYWLYLVIMILSAEKKKDNTTSRKTLFYLVFVFIAIFILSADLLVNLQNYLYQILLGLVISLFLIVLCIDLDSYIHNYLLKAMKNLYKIRQFKIVLLIYTLMLTFFGILLYNSVNNDPILNSFKFNIHNKMVYKY